MMQMQLLLPVLGGLSQLLSVLTSCKKGLEMMRSNPSVVAAILEALEPGTLEVPFKGQPNAQPAQRCVLSSQETFSS